MADVVTHTHKTVRKHVIDLRLPPPPQEDQESFLIRAYSGGHVLELSPADFQQFIAVCAKSLSDATGGSLTVTVQ